MDWTEAKRHADAQIEMWARERQAADRAFWDPLLNRAPGRHTSIRTRWIGGPGEYGPWETAVPQAAPAAAAAPSHVAAGPMTSAGTMGFKKLATRGAVLAGVGLLGYAAYRALQDDPPKQPSWTERVHAQRNAAMLSQDPPVR